MSDFPPYSRLHVDRQALASILHKAFADTKGFGTHPFVRKHLAYLLSLVSNDTFSEIGVAIGLKEIPASTQSEDSSTTNPPSSSLTTALSDLPEFFPGTHIHHIDRGAKSLALLRVAKPDHPLCQPLDVSLSVLLCSGWAWTDDDVEERIELLSRHVRSVNKAIDDWRWNLSASTRSTHSTRLSVPAMHADAVDVEPEVGDPPSRVDDALDRRDLPLELDGLQVFNLEPGTHPLYRTDPPPPGSRTISFQHFIESFPDELPLLAPTLGTLLESVALQPLVTHAKILSSSLLDLFLSEFDFIGHLEMLHRFVLFGNPSFAVRVRSALFADSPTIDANENSQYHRARDRRRASRPGHRRQLSMEGGVINAKPWGVGLNPALSDRGAWPPSGSDLAFALRTVIVDTLDEDRTENEEGEKRTGKGKIRDTIWKEAEWRLGFIIKPFDDDDAGTEESVWADAFGPLALIDQSSPSKLCPFQPSTLWTSSRWITSLRILSLPSYHPPSWINIDASSLSSFVCFEVGPIY